MKATKSFRSSLPDIAWPAIPGAEAARIMGVLFQLDESQWWTAEQIEERQFSQLTRLLNHAYRTIPLYRTRLDSIGWGPGWRNASGWRRCLRSSVQREPVKSAGEPTSSVSWNRRRLSALIL